MKTLKLTSKNYYDLETDWQYLSVSRFKEFLACEAATLAKLKEEYQTAENENLIMGNYLHSYFESEKAHVAFKKSAGQSLLTKGGNLLAKYKQIDQMIHVLEQDMNFTKIYQGQHEAIVTGQLFNADWKGKIDCLNVNSGYFVDLKTCKSLDNTIYNPESRTRESFIYSYGYHIQMAVYKQLLEQKFNKHFTPIIVAISKETVPAHAAIVIPPQKLEEGLATVQNNVARVTAIMNGEIKPDRCEHCDFCKQTYQMKGFKTPEELIQ